MADKEPEQLSLMRELVELSAGRSAAILMMRTRSLAFTATCSLAC